MANYYTHFAFAYTCRNAAMADIMLTKINEYNTIVAHAPSPDEYDGRNMVYVHGSSIDDLMQVYTELYDECGLLGVMSVSFAHTCDNAGRIDGFGGGCLTMTYGDTGVLMAMSDYVGNGTTSRNVDMLPHTGYTGYNTEQMVSTPTEFY